MSMPESEIINRDINPPVTDKGKPLNLKAGGINNVGRKKPVRNRPTLEEHNKIVADYEEGLALLRDQVKASRANRAMLAAVGLVGWIGFIVMVLK